MSIGILGRYLATRLAVRPELAYTMIKPACIASRFVLLQLSLPKLGVLPLLEQLGTMEAVVVQDTWHS